jgi:hypothetical protein
MKAKEKKEILQAFRNSEITKEEARRRLTCLSCKTHGDACRQCYNN